MTARLACVALLLLATGCSAVGTYGRGRVADLQDAFPMSVAWGWGLHMSAQFSPLFQVGLTGIPVRATRWGYDDRMFRGSWREYQVGLPHVLWVESTGVLPEPPSGRSLGERGMPLLYRWQSFRDAPQGEGLDSSDAEPERRSWGRHPPVTRESRGALGWPGMRAAVDYTDLRREQGGPDSLDVIGSPNRTTLWAARRDGRAMPRAWDLFEMDFMFGPAGARLGLRPAEFLDFFLGIFLVDVLGDDLPEPTSADPADREALRAQDGHGG